MNTPSFIYFDLDDTLLDHRRAEKAALEDVCRDFAGLFGAFDVAQVQALYHEHNVPLWHRYALGEIGKDDLKRLRFEHLLEALAVQGSNGVAPAALNTHYLDCYARHWAYIEGAREAFFTLAERFRVGVLTNGFTEIQHAKLDRFPELKGRLASLVVSEDVGYLKPDPRLFAHAAEAAGVAPETILYVGDSYNSDVQGGLGAGWQVAWYQGDPTRLDASMPVLCFDRWDHLLDHLTA